MTNETYLQVSYFTVCLLCLALGAAAYLFLRRPFKETVKHLKNRGLANILKRLFFIGIVFPALLGFFSVSFKSCSMDTYSKIVSDLDYLISKNQEQVSASLLHIVFAIFVWCIIVLFALLILSRERTSAQR